MSETKTFEGAIAIRGRGIGFVTVDENQEDVLIEREALGTAIDGDIVQIELLPKKQNERQQAKVLEVVSRSREEFIGVVEPAEKERSVRSLRPDWHRMHVRILLPQATELDEGKKVVAKISEWKPGQLEPIGEIVEVIGVAGQHETEMQAIIRGGGFAVNFPEPVARAAEELHAKQEALFADAAADTTGEQPRRRDFRDRTTMTIDPADAKDFDDALSFKQLENGNFEIGIHIADVSYYVEEGEHIDMEARDRGTSIYLVDRVIPMLPEVLSNDLCSLRPNEDRLAFSAVFELSPDANIVGEWYGQTIIHSDKRYSYEEAQATLDTGDGPYHAELATMMKLGRLIRKRRYQSGAIAFEQPEVKFELDEEGKPLRVYAKERTETMMMIEDYMLLANQHVTTFIHEHSKSQNKDAAFIYRIHDSPDPDKIDELAIFIHALGYEFETHKGVVTAKNINKLMKEVEGTPEENLIKTATIRSMAKAVYSTKNIGHFGLAFKYYTHFTSPIRRYPDLIAHRMLRKHLDGSNIGPQEIAKYERIAVQCSEREMEAVRAERDSIKYKQVEYMLDKVGQEFKGVITGVTDWGIYVQEKDSLAEGLVRIGNLGKDFYVHEPKKYHIKGEKSGQKFALGDEVKIKLTRADLEEKQLDFELVS